ncbi:hypothetical protein CXF86_15035 [Shewanella sp. GutCb]|uniref:hypothetical protein n=1 Tax=Shewanella sp. GutCb TaxID=2058315 RepID=UPI000C7D7976|nr:hypothetical protein [Shewanella sp. GutCb]PKG73999.1 hypothetical protein CXF86_15035 [Shewanella sp. GutCb]
MKLLSTLFISSVLFSSSALAIDNYYIECSSCVTESQFTQIAKDNAIHRENIYVNVMNFKNYEIKKYAVYKNSKTVCDPNGREPDGEGGFIYDCWLEKTLTADKVNITNTELNLFIDLANSTNALNQEVSQRTIGVPKEILPSGLDIVGSSYKGNSVISYYDSLSYFDSSVIGKYLIAFEALSKTISAGITINAPAVKFTFSDNTVAYAVFDFVDSDGIAHLKFIKITGENGLELDLTKDNPFKKNYDVSGMSLTSWQSLLTAFKAYGLAVNIADTSTVPKGSVTIIDCSNSTETVCRNPL